MQSDPFDDQPDGLRRARDEQERREREARKAEQALRGKTAPQQGRSSPAGQGVRA